MIFFQINGHAEWGWGGCSVLPPFPPPRECAVEGNSQPFPGEEALLLPRIFIRHGKVGPAPRSGGSRSFLSLTGTRFGCSLPTCAAAEAKRTSPGPMSPSSTRSSGSGAAPGREGVPGAAWEQGERRPRGRRGIPVGYRQPICPRVHPRSPRPVPAPFLHPPAPGEDTGGVAPRCPGRGGPAVGGRSGGRTGPPHPGSAARREAALPGFSARSRGEPEPHAASPALPSAPPVPGAGPAMPSYPQRTLTVLLLFGTLSAAMALLASSLIFQLPAGRTSPGSGPGAVRGALPESAAAVLLPVSAVLAALCLVLNVSCLLLCLLHGYFSTELCRGQPGPER